MSTGTGVNVLVVLNGSVELSETGSGGVNVLVVLNGSVELSEMKESVTAGDAKVLASNLETDGSAKSNGNGKSNAKTKAKSSVILKAAGNGNAMSYTKSHANSHAEVMSEVMSDEEDSSNVSSSEEVSNSSVEDMEVFAVTSNGLCVDEFNNFFLEAVRTFESIALFNDSHQTNATWLKYACTAALTSWVVPRIDYMKRLKSCNWTSLNTAVKQLLSYTGLNKASMKILKALCKDKVI